MAFSQMAPISWKFTGQPYDLNSVLSPDQVWAMLDLPPEEVRTALNTLIAALNSTADASSGADNLGATAVTNLDGTTVQALIESLRNKLKATTDGSSGADFVNATAITGLTGTTIQALLEALKEYADDKDAAQTGALTTHKTSGDHDTRYYKKEELAPFLRGGDTLIRYDVFTIVNSNNGDGTFSYQDKNEAIRIGELTEEGYQVFTLQSGNYVINQNRIEATVNDTLGRSTASGGLLEIDSTHVALTMPEGNGAEITFKYYERIGITGTGLIVMGDTPPPDGFFWFKVVG